MMSNYGDLTVEHSIQLSILQLFRVFCQYLKKKRKFVNLKGLKQKHVDPYSLWTPLTLEVFLTTSMGLKKDIQGVKDHSYLEDMEQ